MNTIGERIAKLRLHRGLTQAELGEAIGETKQTIYKYEHGVVTNIPLQKVEAIAKALHCPPALLTGWGKDEESRTPRDEEREALNQLFDQLTPEEKKIVIAQLRGMTQSRSNQDDQ